MKLTDMKQVLAAHNIQLSKSLGQNFLHDANQLRRIVAAAEEAYQAKVDQDRGTLADRALDDQAAARRRQPHRPRSRTSFP